MPFNWRRPFSNKDDQNGPVADDVGPTIERVHDAEISDGSLKYTLEKGGNDSLPSYQEASGAPVESHSPLGYSVGPVTIIFLNVSKMIGTGVYSTRECYLPGTVGVGMLTGSQLHPSSRGLALSACPWFTGHLDS